MPDTAVNLAQPHPKSVHDLRVETSIKMGLLFKVFDDEEAERTAKRLEFHNASRLGTATG